MIGEEIAEGSQRIIAVFGWQLSVIDEKRTSDQKETVEFRSKQS